MSGCREGPVHVWSGQDILMNAGTHFPTLIQSRTLVHEMLLPTSSLPLSDSIERPHRYTKVRLINEQDLTLSSQADE